MALYSIFYSDFLTKTPESASWSVSYSQGAHRTSLVDAKRPRLDIKKGVMPQIFNTFLITTLNPFFCTSCNSLSEIPVGRFWPISHFYTADTLVFNSHIRASRIIYKHQYDWASKKGTWCVPYQTFKAPTHPAYPTIGPPA